MHIFLIVAVAVAIVAAITYGYIVAQQRRDALAALAGRLGLSFHEDKDRDLARSLSFLDKLDQGSNRYVHNRISGNYQGHEVMAFDYHYQTESGKHTNHYDFSVLTLKLPRSFPELLITPEGFLSKIAQSLGYDDIDMESAEFSSAFCVRSPNKKFAYDVCHPRMMEYLLAHRYLAIEFEGNGLALTFDSCLDVPEVERALQQLVEIRCLMPDYLFPKT